jgi:23S rRNA (uracil1939-C5)-methyltransferase
MRHTSGRKVLLKCEYVGRCGGCNWGALDPALQIEQKIAQVRGVFPQARFVFTPEARVRDKVDLVWEEGRLGLYEVHKENERSKILDLEHCAMMSAGLEAFFKEFRKLKPPIRKGSVRLRVSPQGERGAWLDFANQDVKTLFDEKNYLRALSEIAFVEIGQRRKSLIWKEGAPKLNDPVLKPWFETYDAQGKAIPLFGPVGGFSQTGFQANRALVGAVVRAVKNSGISRWLELFSGNGNFSLALAAAGLDVEAIEMDELALRGLEKSLASSDRRLTIKFGRADVYLKSKNLPAIEGRGLLVDPPRAGLRELLQVLEQGERPEALVYVSCFTDVLLADLEKLKSLGYKISSLEGVDQFPNSAHAEWIALLTRQ